MFYHKVFVAKIRAIDRLAASALLFPKGVRFHQVFTGKTQQAAYISLGEISTLCDKSRDNTVKSRALVIISLLASAQFSKVPGSLWYNVIIEFELNLALVFC